MFSGIMTREDMHERYCDSHPEKRRRGKTCIVGAFFPFVNKNRFRQVELARNGGSLGQREHGAGRHCYHRELVSSERLVRKDVESRKGDRFGSHARCIPVGVSGIGLS